ncbi:hypothetical protein AAF712_012216 [Marasmius tenuissimus]|uniref:Uncharacterized protein n=1 Tax=Marasmius tenuissimus TaxID=585030 RepID=A0ABR2ZI13_9AGAR
MPPTYEIVNGCNDSTHFVVGYQGIWATFRAPSYYSVEKKVFSQWGVDDDFILSVYCTEQDTLVVRQQRVDPERRQTKYWKKLWKKTPRLRQGLPPDAWQDVLPFTRPFHTLPNHVRQWWAIIEVHKPLRTVLPNSMVRKQILFQQGRFIRWFNDTLEDEFTINGVLTDQILFGYLKLARRQNRVQVVGERPGYSGLHDWEMDLNFLAQKVPIEPVSFSHDHYQYKVLAGLMKN